MVCNLPLLGMAWILLVQRCVKTLFLHPFGAQMCQDLCRQLSGCEGYIFFPVNLICYVNTDGCLSQTNIDGGVPLNVTKVRKMPCKIHRRFLRTSLGTYQCVDGPFTNERVINEVTTASNGSNGQNSCPQVMKHLDSTSGNIQPRLLIANRMNLKPKEVLQLRFSCIKIQKYNHIPEKPSVGAVAYASKICSLLVSHWGVGITAFKLDSDEEKFISNLFTSSMTVDDDEQLVFFLNDKKTFDRSVCRMTTNGSSVRMIYTTDSVMFTIIVDAKQQRVLISTTKGLLCLSYDGKIYSNKLSKRKMNIGLTMDTAGTIYFSSDTKLFKFEQNRVKHIATFSFQIAVLIFDRQYIYVAFQSSDVIVFELSSGKTVCKFRIHHKPTFLTMCLVK